MPQFSVLPVPLGYKLVMGAALNETAFVKHGDVVTELTGGEPVRDEDCCLVAY